MLAIMTACVVLYMPKTFMICSLAQKHKINGVNESFNKLLLKTLVIW